MRSRNLFPLLVVLVLGGAVEAAAQEPAVSTDSSAAAAALSLNYEREIFSYSVERGRRDPFISLAGKDELGPRFGELALQGVIYSSTPGQSVALVASAGKIYRVRRGDIIGNSRVLNITPERVLFAVENFGIVRQEVLELKAQDKKE